MNAKASAGDKNKGLAAMLAEETAVPAVPFYKFVSHLAKTQQEPKVFKMCLKILFIIYSNEL